MKAFLSENIQISTRLCKKKKIAELIKRNISVNEERIIESRINTTGWFTMSKLVKY